MQALLLPYLCVRVGGTNQARGRSNKINEKKNTRKKRGDGQTSIITPNTDVVFCPSPPHVWLPTSTNPSEDANPHANLPKFYFWQASPSPSFILTQAPEKPYTPHPPSQRWTHAKLFAAPISVTSATPSSRVKIPVVFLFPFRPYVCLLQRWCLPDSFKLRLIRRRGAHSAPYRFRRVAYIAKRSPY